MRISVVLVLLVSHVQLFSLHTETNFPDQEKNIIKGIVFHDINGNGVYEAEKDAPLKGIAVSNGRAIVLTDHNGFYELPVYDHSVVFLIKPRNWMVPVDEDQIPRFYYIHSPQV